MGVRHHGVRYGQPMNTHDVAPRSSTNDRNGIRREGRPARRRLHAGAVAAGLAMAIGIAACSTGATLPSGSIAVPSVDVSAGASMATEAAKAALDQVDVAIAENQTSGALTNDEANALQDLSAGIRTSLQSGNVTAARTAFDNLSTKVDEFAVRMARR